MVIQPPCRRSDSPRVQHCRRFVFRIVDTGLDPEGLFAVEGGGGGTESQKLEPSGEIGESIRGGLIVPLNCFILQA